MCLGEREAWQAASGLGGNARRRTVGGALALGLVGCGQKQ